MQDYGLPELDYLTPMQLRDQLYGSDHLMELTPLMALCKQVEELHREVKRPRGVVAQFTERNQ